MSNKYQQRLFWSVSRPLKYLGLTMDEWFVAAVTVFPGVFLLLSQNIQLGLGCFIGGFFTTWSLKKYKRLSQGFKLKSFLLSKGLWRVSQRHPRMLNKAKVGK